jgi:hypothetical protein
MYEKGLEGLLFMAYTLNCIEIAMKISKKASLDFRPTLYLEEFGQRPVVDGHPVLSGMGIFMIP